MNKINSPLYYSEAAAETIMNKFPPALLPPVYKLSYHHGIFYSGMLRTYFYNGNEKYLSYVKERCEMQIDSRGNIRNEENTRELDDLQPGIILLYLYNKTHDERYKAAADSFAEAIKRWPVNSACGFWHKNYMPDQMWLDALYMLCPFCAEYAKMFGDESLLDIAIAQIKLTWEHTYDEKTGLPVHGWDASRRAEWADTETGKAPEFWGRSISWIGVAITDVLGFMPENHPKRSYLCELLKKYMSAVVRYQTKNGLWFQVVNKGHEKGNWEETSCACLFVYAMLKGMRLGILPAEYEKYAFKGYAGVLSRAEINGSVLSLGGVCVGTGIGSYDYYIGRETSSGDLHGMGAFMLMCTQMQDYTAEKEKSGNAR